MKKQLPNSAFFRNVTVILVFTLLAFTGYTQTVQTFSTSGSWTCPYGVTSVKVETWGGGGAGGGATNKSAGGGGGGAYTLTSSLAVTYGTVYNYVVGTGATGTTGAGAAGGASSFNSGTIANGGAGGGAGSTSNGASGAGGTGTNAGGAGAAGTGAHSGGGGGGAGSSVAGTTATTQAGGTGGTGGGGTGGAGTTTTGVGLPGGTLSGGGGGAKMSSGSALGGNGANGEVKITYTINCTAPPAQPTALILTPTANAVAGSFTAASYTDGYLVIRTATAAAPTAPVDGTTYTAGSTVLGGYIEYAGAATSFTSSSLAANTQYWYWVFAYNNVTCVGGINYLNTGPLSNNSFTACTAPANQPTAFVLTPSATSIAGSFTASSPAASGYLVVRTATSTAPSSPVNGTTYTVGASALGGIIEAAGSSTTFTSSSLAANTQYWYWVFGFNNTSCAIIAYKTASPLSNNSFTACTAPTTQPTSLILTPSATSIAGSFTASSPAASGYLVVRTSTATPPTNPVDGTTYTAGTSALGGYIETAGASISFTSSSLSANTQYWYWVFDYNNTTCAGGPKYFTASPLTANSFTACTAPTNQPTALVLTPSATSIAGSFTASSPAASGYLVVRTATSTAPSSPVNGTTYTVGASALGGIIESAGASTTFTSASLAVNTQYWYWVFGYNNTSCAIIAYKTATPLSSNSFTACTAPTNQPTSLVLTPSATSIAGSFTASSPAASGYLVIRTATSTAPSSPVNGTTYTVGASALGGIIESAGSSTTFTSASLAANTQYWYWVFGYNNTSCAIIAYNISTPLSNNSFTACTAPTNQPTALVLTPSATSIAGSFTASSPAASGYLVVRTATSAAPSSPVNGTTYTIGASALGGIIESAGSSTTFTSSSLAANTQYWYWVFGYNNTSCTIIAYNISTPLSNNSFTACTAPATQATALVLTPSSNSIAGSFTAASPAASGYLVVRTATATAPASPVNGTTYSAGTSALGGFIESAGSSTTFSSTSLAANTAYWYWIFSYNNTSCAGGPAYFTTTPLSGTSATCTAPTAQPTSLVLTPYANVVNISFTASASATAYLIVRTATSAAPANPADGTTYTVGSSALGGIIESAGASASVNSLSLSTTTQYWYWIFAYNTTTCGTKYLTPSVNGTTTTVACGTHTNVAIITTPGTATYNWSALTWSLGHLPTTCEHAQLTLNDAGAADDNITVNLDVNVQTLNFDMTDASAASPYVHHLYLSGSKLIDVAGNLTVTSPGGNKYNRCVISNADSTIVHGNVILGRVSPSATEGHSAVGSGTHTPNQVYLFYGDMTFNPRGYTTDEYAKFIFDKAGTQHIYNYTTVTDTIEPVLFEYLVVGSANASTVIFGGTTFDAYMENVGRQGLIIGTNSTMVLPGNFSFNRIAGGTAGFLKMLPGSRLKLGGNQSIAGSFGVAGSNFPNGFTLTLDPTSTIEYNGLNSITQTVYAAPTYQNLELSNGSGSGRAPKINTGGINAAVSININALADWTLGSTVASTGPFNVLATGGLYCGTKIVSGAGAFTLNSGGYLGMGDPAGITSGAFATGNVQMTGGRSFSTGGNYIYNGAVAQITGSGLPTTCNDLTIDNPTTVTIGSSQNVTGTNALKQGLFDIGATHLTITGASGILSSVAGKMKANTGIVDMNGSSGTAQALDGNWFLNRNISTLINSNTKGITLAATANDTLIVSSALLYGTGTTNSAITTNDNLTLLSRDTATARFGEIVSASGNSIAGKVNVERFIGSGRKWRHLAWPTTSSQTARDSWMEKNAVANGNLTPGYGTVVTDEKTTWATNNFDSRSVSGPSVKYYDPATDTYIGIPNTTVYTMNSQSAYYNYVRGDRSCTPANSSLSSTVLRSTGTLKTGSQVFSITANKFAAIGNPYASPVDLRKLDTLNLTSTFYIWDPKLTGGYGLGAYQTVYKSGTDYKVLPGGGSYGALASFTDTLESGQALFVKARSAAGTLTFKENAKTMQARSMARPGPNNEQNLFAILSLVDSLSNTLVDGCMASFDGSFSSSVDDDDAVKMSNTGENTSFKRSGKLLAIERRQNIIADDTLFLNLTGTRYHQYKWDVILNNMYAPNRTAFFIDKFLNTSTPIDLEHGTTIQFTITSPAGSWAADRFFIVFKPLRGTLPVHFTTISAERNKDQTVIVKWNAENELNMQDYKVQRSADGNRFTNIGTQLPSVNNGGNAAYSLTDPNASAGSNYYRVLGNSINGQAQYTAIVKVGPLGIEQSFSISPDPVTDGNVNVHFTNQPKGNYAVKITNKIGQEIYSKTINAAGDNFVTTIRLANKTAPGSYQLTLINNAGEKITIPFMLQ